MAKKIPNVDLLTETFDTWLNRTNSVIDVLGSEVITANTTLGVTGTPAVQLNSRLFGTFTANNLVAATTLNVPGAFIATPTLVSINAPISINGSVGANGQILTSNGSALSWTTLRIDTAANSGLIGGPITSSGELRVKVGNGIKVDNSGIYLDVPFVQSQITGVSTLQGYTWEAPGSLGSTTANTGNFTTATATNYRITGVSSDNFLLSSSVIRTAGIVDAITPGNGTSDTNGGVRIRSRGTGRATLQFTNQTATSEFGNISVDSAGLMYWPGSFRVNVNNNTGAGLILSDDGDFVDLNDGYGSLRFGNGVAVYSGNKSGSSVIRLRSNGNIEASGTITTNGNSVLTLNDFTRLAGSNGWTRLPNGLILQYGTATSFAQVTTTITYPTSFSSFSIAVVSGGEGGANAQDNNPYVTSAGTSSFTVFNARNLSCTVWWIAIGY